VPDGLLRALGVTTIDRRKTMSRLKNFARSLTRPRAGFSADGRALGLGLSTALTEQRKDAEAVAAVAKTLHPGSQGRDSQGRDTQGRDAEGHTIHG
jgi:hypothetical protein